MKQRFQLVDKVIQKALPLGSSKNEFTRIYQRDELRINDRHCSFCRRPLFYGKADSAIDVEEE
jgi:hypothetical protein